MVKKKIVFVSVAIILVVILFCFFIYNFRNETFSVKTFLLKSNVPIGGSYEYKINIENNDNLMKEFDISIEGDIDFFSINENNFVLEPYGKKEILVFFEDEDNKVEVYSGELVISEGFEEKRIPIIVTVEDDRNLLSIIHSTIASYYDVYPGGKLGLDIKVYDLNDLSVPSLTAESFIQNIQGEILWTNEEDLIVDGSKTEIVNIPSNWPKGNYIFVTIIDYKGVKSISSYLFSLEDKSYNLLQNFNAKLLILIILGFVLGFVSLFFYFIKSRDEFLKSLKRQQNKELAQNISLIKSSRSKIVKSKVSPVEKKKKIRKLNKLKRKIIYKIKKKQAIQRRELKKLRKKHKKGEMQRKLKSWQNQGYKMFEAEKELGSSKNAKKQISKWKRQGYKI